MANLRHVVGGMHAWIVAGIDFGVEEEDLSQSRSPQLSTCGWRHACLESRRISPSAGQYSTQLSTVLGVFSYGARVGWHASTLPVEQDP